MPWWRLQTLFLKRGGMHTGHGDSKPSSWSVVGCIPVMLNTFLSQITQWRPCSVDHSKDTDYPMTILLTSLTLQGCSLVSFSDFIWNGCDAFYHLNFNKMHFCPCYVWSVIPPPVSVVLMFHGCLVLAQFLGKKFPVCWMMNCSSIYVCSFAK